MAEGDGKQDKLEDHVDVEQEKQKEVKKAAGLIGQDYDSTTEDEEEEEAAVVDAVGTAIEEAVTKTEDKDKGPREVPSEPTATEVQEKELQASSEVDKEESLESETKDATTDNTNKYQH